MARVTSTGETATTTRSKPRAARSRAVRVKRGSSSGVIAITSAWGGSTRGGTNARFFCTYVNTTVARSSVSANRSYCTRPELGRTQSMVPPQLMSPTRSLRARYAVASDAAARTLQSSVVAWAAPTWASVSSMSTTSALCSRWCWVT